MSLVADNTVMASDWSTVAYRQVVALAESLDDGAQPMSVAPSANRLVDLLRQTTPRDADPASARSLLEGALEVEASLRANHEGSPASLRLGLETIRQSLDRLREEQTVADSQPLDELIGWLLTVTHITPTHLSRLLNVSPTTLRRWSTPRRDDAVETEEMQRVRVLAHVVQHLNHVLTGRGVVSWLETAHPMLKDQAPAELISEPSAVAELVSLASQGRSQAAS